MPRPAKYDEFSILAATAKLVAADGPRAATMSAISQSMGAPNGSIYYRFTSRDALLGQLWLMKASTFQDAWARALDEPDARRAGLQAALSLPRVARMDLEGARIMLLHRRDDFLSEGWPPEMKAEAERLGRQVSERLDEMTKHLFERLTDETRLTTIFATLDLPMAAVRRYVAIGKRPPAMLDELITSAYWAVIERPV